MFDIGFSEVLLLAIISLVVLGPERLPHAARLAGAWMGKARRVFFDFKHEVESEIQAKELKDRLDKLQQQINESMSTLNLPDPAQAQPDQATNTEDPTKHA